MKCRNYIEAMFYDKSRKDLLDYVCKRIDDLEEENYKICEELSKINKATNYYLQTLNEYNKENKNMPDEAVEMFNKIGYTKDSENEWDLTYSKEIGNNPFYKSPVTINFRKMTEKTVEKYDANGNSMPIYIYELQAINKQVEELGWLEEVEE